MPTYDYECAACGRRFEVVHGVHADGPTSCPLCGKGPVRKVITAANVHYKGSGWAKKERRSTATAAAKNAASGGGSDDGSASGAAPSADGDGSGSPARTSTDGSKESTAAAPSKSDAKGDKRPKSSASTTSD
jgi:putative FmdB family regulatory protein